MTRKVDQMVLATSSLHLRSDVLFWRNYTLFRCLFVLSFALFFCFIRFLAQAEVLAGTKPMLV